MSEAIALMSESFRRAVRGITTFIEASRLRDHIPRVIITFAKLRSTPQGDVRRSHKIPVSKPAESITIRLYLFGKELLVITITQGDQRASGNVSLDIVIIAYDRIGHNATQCTNEDLPSYIDKTEILVNKTFL